MIRNGGPTRSLLYDTADRRSDATGDRIVRAAARLFLARSYHSVGVNEICIEASVKKERFYHFFESNSDLAIAVIDHDAAAMWRLLHEKDKREGPSTRSVPPQRSHG